MNIEDFKDYEAFKSDATTKERATTICVWIDFIHSSPHSTYADLSRKVELAAKTDSFDSAWKMFSNRESLVEHGTTDHSIGLFSMTKKEIGCRKYSIRDENPSHTLGFVEYVIKRKLKELSPTAESRLQCHFEIISRQNMVEQVNCKVLETFTNDIRYVLLITNGEEWGIFVSLGIIGKCLLFLPCHWEIPSDIFLLNSAIFIQCYQGGSDYRIAAVALWIQSLQETLSDPFSIIAIYSLKNAQENFPGIQKDVNIFLEAYKQQLESRQLLGSSDQPQSCGEAKLRP